MMIRLSANRDVFLLGMQWESGWGEDEEPRIVKVRKRPRLRSHHRPSVYPLASKGFLCQVLVSVIEGIVKVAPWFHGHQGPKSVKMELSKMGFRGIIRVSDFDPWPALNRS